MKIINTTLVWELATTVRIDNSKLKGIVFLLFLLLISCASEKQDTGKSQTINTIAKKKALQKKIEPEPNPAITNNHVIEPKVDTTSSSEVDSEIISDIELLDKKYASTPFYANINGQKFYIVSNDKWHYKMERFGGELKYGIVNDSLIEITKVEYDKVYNPNLVINDCFEVKRGSSVGLVNYKTGIILQPQFDYILPSSNIITNTAFGYKDNKWFKIENSDITSPSQVSFNPTPVLKTLSFSVESVGKNMMYDSYYEYQENDANEGRGVVIVPSFAEHLKLFMSDFYLDIILPDQKKIVDFGTESAQLKTSFQKTITDKITSFFVSVYELGIDARGYEVESEQLIVYNSERNIVKSLSIGSVHENDILCRESGYRFVNDSIIEVRSNNNGYDLDERLYNFETKYTYHQLMDDGNITELSSNRHFDFTKFILINEKHFKGCYAIFMESASEEGHNIWLSDHLTIEDLDIMRNEIFADHGYKFKTEKWQNYFSNMPWYIPKYDDVNDKLSEIEKANIEVILEVKKRMQEKKNFINRRPSTYYAPA